MASPWPDQLQKACYSDGKKIDLGFDALKVAVKRLAHAINCFNKYCRNKAVYHTEL